MGGNCSGCNGCSKRDDLLNRQAQENNIIDRTDIDDAIRNSQQQMITTKFNFNIDDILKNQILRERTLYLCQEKEVLVKHGGDAGFIKFVEKYISSKTVKTIFSNCEIEQISNLNDLQSVFVILIILYKAQITKIKNLVFERINNDTTPMNKSEIKPIANYLSIWIIKKYGSNDNHILIQQNDFTLKITKYLKDFVKSEYKSFDSIMEV